jgi:hypothetical protein
VHIYLLKEQARLLELGVRHVFQRRGDTWLSFNVTAAVRRPEPVAQLRFLVHIRATSPRSQLDLALVVTPYDRRQVEDVQPLLLLSYSALTVFFFLFVFHYFHNFLSLLSLIHYYVIERFRKDGPWLIAQMNARQLKAGLGSRNIARSIVHLGTPPPPKIIER